MQHNTNERVTLYSCCCRLLRFGLAIVLRRLPPLLRSASVGVLVMLLLFPLPPLLVWLPPNLLRQWPMLALRLSDREEAPDSVGPLGVPLGIPTPPAARAFGCCSGLLGLAVGARGPPFKRGLGEEVPAPEGMGPPMRGVVNPALLFEALWEPRRCR